MECYARVGLPPRNIFWYRKYPQDQAFQLVKKKTEAETLQSSSCVPYVKQSLMTSITETRSGTIYRCQVEEANYDDEIEIRLPGNNLIITYTET